jgi:hypothetical protein
LSFSFLLFLLFFAGERLAHRISSFTDVPRSKEQKAKDDTAASERRLAEPFLAKPTASRCFAFSLSVRGFSLRLLLTWCVSLFDV